MKSNPQTETLIRCPCCGKKIFDGRLLRARVSEFKKGVAYSKCCVCKTWVKVPQIKIAK